MPENFLYEKDGPVTTITFNRPQRRNCMSRAVLLNSRICCKTCATIAKLES